MKKLYFLIGYPASGKTTLAKKLHKEKGFEYISTDDMFQKLFDEGYHYSQIKRSLEKNTAMQIIEKGFISPNIVVDCYSPFFEERKAILEAIPETYEKIAVVMDTPLEECIKRFNKREHFSNNYIPYFAEEKIDEPTLQEFDQIIRSSDLYDRLCKKIYG